MYKYSSMQKTSDKTKHSKAKWDFVHVNTSKDQVFEVYNELNAT